MKTLLLLIVSACYGQTKLTTPTIVLPNVQHTVGGEFRIMAPNNTDFASIQTTSNAVVFKGKAANNGNIVLSPGNVSSLAGVFIVTPRLDSTAFTIQDAVGTTTAKSVRLLTSGNVEYFSITMGTDATNPGLVSTYGLAPLTADTFNVGSASNRYLEMFGRHGDFRQTDDTAPAVYAASTTSTGQSAIFGESLTGSGPAGRFKSDLGTTGPAILAESAVGPAIHAVGAIVNDNLVSGGGFRCVHSDTIGQLFTDVGDCVTPTSWVSFTPSVTGFTSTISSGGIYNQVGKVLVFKLVFTGVSDGTNPTFTLPVTPNTLNNIATCYISNLACTAAGGTAYTVRVYNNSALTATSTYTIALSGTYDVP